MEGWIKLHRNSLNHWLYKENRPLTKREAWENMLLIVNYESNKVLINGSLIECERGQCLYSLGRWAKEFNWTIQQIRTFFKLLQNDNMITLENCKKTTRLTICNYDTYQDKQHATNTQLTRRQHADNTQLTTIKERKERKERKEVLLIDSEFSKFEKLLNADNWQDKFPDVDLKYYYDTINDWSLSNNKKYIDWLAMIRNWIRRDFQQNKMVKNYNKIINGVVIGRTAM